MNRYRLLLEAVLGKSTINTLVSTAEHIGPFNLRSQTSFLIPQLCLSELASEPVDILLLASSLVPLDNSSYPRGFMLPSMDGKERVKLFTNKDKHRSPLLMPAVVASDQPSFNKLIRIAPWLREVFDATDGYESYAHQLAACMERLVNRWTNSLRHTRITITPSETIERKILISLLENNDPVLCNILMDNEERHALYEELTRDSAGALLDPSGAFLAYNHQGRLETLFERTKGWWENSQSRFQIERTVLIDGLAKGLLWPRPLLSMIILSYLPNLPICGGNRQKAYYSWLLRSLNTITGMKRCDSLNVQGYLPAEVDYDSFSMWPGGGLVPPYGTGLALAVQPFSPEWALEQYGLHSRFSS